MSHPAPGHPHPAILTEIALQKAPCDQSGLAARRGGAGATQAQIAEAAGITRSKVGRLEKMVESDSAALAAYDSCPRRMESRKEQQKALDNT